MEQTNKKERTTLNDGVGDGLKVRPCSRRGKTQAQSHEVGPAEFGVCPYCGGSKSSTCPYCGMNSDF